jgi:hypothetical protein
MKKSILQVRRSVKKINLSNIEHSFDHTFIGTFIVNDRDADALVSFDYDYGPKPKIWRVYERRNKKENRRG